MNHVPGWYTKEIQITLLSDRAYIFFPIQGLFDSTFLFAYADVL